MVKPSAIICDLDGTLSDCRHRLCHVDGSRKKDWDAFFSLCGSDPLHEWCAYLLHRLHEAGERIILVSGRPNLCREDTTAWLDRNAIRYHDLWMRPTYMRMANGVSTDKRDYRPDDIVKEEIYRLFIEPDYNVRLVIDDRPKVVAMWRRIGLICLQAEPHE